MVYWTSHQQSAKYSGDATANESYRVKYGFKELEIHNNPQRRNKDFKPMLYGDFIGMLNFKISEPWTLLRNLPDLVNEQSQLPIQWAKAAIKGGFIGFWYGTISLFNMEANSFVEKKLYLSTNKGPFSLGIFNYMAKYYTRPMGTGAGIFLSYRLAYDLFVHHSEAKEVPEMVTHFKIWGLLTPLLIAYLWKPKYIIVGTVSTLMFVFPLFYWLKGGMRGEIGEKDQYYFYLDSVNKAERDKFEWQDKIEAIGLTRMNEFAYGDQRHHNHNFSPAYGK